MFHRVDSWLWEAAAWPSTPFSASVGSWVCSHNTAARAVSVQKLKSSALRWSEPDAG